MSEREDEIRSIVKFIKEFYNPKSINIGKRIVGDQVSYEIRAIFETVDDKYITNPQHKDTKELKEKMFARQIRTDVENFLGIKTTGLQPRNNFLSPAESHGIRIVIMSEK